MPEESIDLEEEIDNKIQEDIKKAQKENESGEQIMINADVTFLILAIIILGGLTIYGEYLLSGEITQIKQDTQLLVNNGCYIEKVSYCLAGCTMAIGKNDAETQNACLNACKTKIALTTKQKEA